MRVLHEGARVAHCSADEAAAATAHQSGGIMQPYGPVGCCVEQQPSGSSPAAADGIWRARQQQAAAVRPGGPSPVPVGVTATASKRIRCRRSPHPIPTRPPSLPPLFTHPRLQRGILAKYGIELIGAKLPSIDRAEDRELFKQSMTRIGLKCAKSGKRDKRDEMMHEMGTAGSA